MDTQEPVSPRAPSPGDMYSTAFNFYSHIHAGVDTRTGMYSASIELSTGNGNALRGPSFTFRLAYDALAQVDDGFGNGWVLDITRFDRSLSEPMLHLGGGETFRAERIAAGQPAKFPDRKLDSFRFTPGGELETAVVEHVTGMVEVLTRAGASRDILRTTSIFQPNGDAVHLSWARQENGLICLTGAEDDAGNQLLTITYPSLTEIIVMLFNGGEVPVTLKFIRSGKLLKQVLLPDIRSLNAARIADDDEATWAFDYKNLSGEGDSPTITLLSDVTSPNGIRETVYYQDSAIRLPDNAPWKYMPAVARRVQRLVADPSVIVSQSRYSFRSPNEHSFYGYPVVEDWVNRHDQLIHSIQAGTYRYKSVETVIDEADHTLIEIERTYDNYHLMNLERTTRGEVATEVQTVYGALPGTTFEEQPNAFQLPHASTTKTVDGVTGCVREARTDTTYDDLGNVLTTHDSATGIKEISDYYSAEGEPGHCPPDPLGRVRRLKSRTIEPGVGGGQTRRVSYDYCTVPVLRNPTGDPARDVYVQACAEIEEVFENGVWRELSRSTQRFIVDHGPQHGCLLDETRSIDGIQERRTYEYDTDRSRGTRTLSITHTVDSGTDDNGEPRTIVNHTSETSRLIDGLVIAAVDAAGNRTATTYDTLGRRVAETVHPGDGEYEATMTWSYMLSTRERWIERTGVTGLRHRQWFDAMGHAVLQEEPLEDLTLYAAVAAEYDILGQCIRRVDGDRLAEGKELELETLYDYDDWGDVCWTQLPDGSEIVRITSLIQDMTVYGDEVISRTMEWREADGDCPAGWTSVDTDAAGRKRRAQSGYWAAPRRRRSRFPSPMGGRMPVAVATQRWEYDGLGRCVLSVDAMGLETRQIWDARDRVTETVLPDGTRVTREFAAGHEDELVARLTVTPRDGDPILLGTRKWDGLGRIEEETAGSLTYRFGYVPGQLQPATKTMPGGAVVHMRYDRKLGEVLTEMTLDDVPVQPSVAAQSPDRSE